MQFLAVKQGLYSNMAGAQIDYCATARGLLHCPCLKLGGRVVELEGIRKKPNCSLVIPSRMPEDCMNGQLLWGRCVCSAPYMVNPLHPTCKYDL